MTHEQAKSELMQIYMSLSEEKKQALDVLMAQADGEYILKKDVMCCIGQTSVHSELARKLRKLPSVAIPSAEPKVGRCEDCKHFRKLPLRTDTSIGKCIQHWGVCPPCDWYCADFEPQESEDKHG